MAEKRSFLLAYPDGCEEPYRTRRRVLIGSVLMVERPDARVPVRVTGMGWEGEKFVLHVAEVFP